MFKEIKETLHSLNPSEKELRWFGIIAILILLLLSYRFPRGIIFFAVLGGWVVSGLVMPRVLRRLYLVAMALTLPLGWIFSRALLTLFFYLVVSPTAFLQGALKRDLLHLNFKSDNNSSFWEEVEENKNYEKMY